MRPWSRHVVKRHASKSDRLIEVLFTRAMTDDRAYRLYKQLTDGQDAPEVRSAVDRYQSALLMPKWLIQEAEQRYDFTKWPNLYRLAEEAQVNITNLIVRLQRLGLILLARRRQDDLPERRRVHGTKEPVLTRERSDATDETA